MMTGGGILKVCGIIAEFDPFHRGHLHLLKEAKAGTGCDHTVCVISTAFLQRGTQGLFSTMDRARMALEAGADAVFALPVSFSCAPADRFALGGVRLLAGTGVVTHQAFGCENAADADLLLTAARCLNEETGAFRDALRRRLETGMPYPRARAEALEESAGIPAALLAAPNNILAIAYLRQLLRLDNPIEPVFVQRRGSRDAAKGAPDGLLPSSAIRELLLNSAPDGCLPDSAAAALPAASAAILRECLTEGRVCPPEALTQALLYRLYTLSPGEATRYTDSQEGLEHRLEKALSARPASRAALVDALKTRRYTHAGLQRWLSRILLDLPADTQPEMPGYLRLLGFRASAQPLIRAISRASSLPLITKPARGRAYLDEDARAEWLWGLGAGRPASLYEQSPVIIPDQQ